MQGYDWYEIIGLLRGSASASIWGRKSRTDAGRRRSRPYKEGGVGGVLSLDAHGQLGEMLESTKFKAVLPRSAHPTSLRWLFAITLAAGRAVRGGLGSLVFNSAVSG